MREADTVYVAHVGDPFSVAPLTLMMCERDRQPRLVSISEFSSERRAIVSYDIRTLIDACRFENVSPPNTLIDVEDALRLWSGLSRAQGGMKKWSVWTLFPPELMSAADLQIIQKLIEGRELQPERDELLRLVGATAFGLSRVWEVLLEELDRAEEKDRFFRIEVPVRQVFSKRQYLGIALDQGACSSLIEEATRDKYTAFRETATILGFSPAGLSFHNVGRYLNRTDASSLAEYGESEQLEQYFKIAQHSSKFANAFLQYIKASRALSVLRTINSRAERVYPAFNCVGTVSARILVADPRLQQLPKRLRHVLSADHGRALWYFDYAQFEPGILAHLAGDERFIEFYETSDIYQSLSTAVFNSEKERDLCKSIFLAFCYGMSVDRLALLLTQNHPSETAEIQARISQFFEALPALAEFKTKAEQQLEHDGFVSSLFGNRRYRTSTGPLLNSEKRWALNQAVQGTASLIFKQAVIELERRYGSDAILLPMHDALLMQFDEGDDVRLEVENTMIDAFKAWCPTVTPRVTAGSFALPVTHL